MTHLQVIQGGGPVDMGLADYVWLNAWGDICSRKRSILIARDHAGDPVPLVDRWVIRDQGVALVLAPCFYLPDPTRPQPNYIVLCEVRDEQDVGVEYNHRSRLRQMFRERDLGMTYFGFEQSYQPLGFDVSERHIGSMLDAGILFHSASNQLDMDTWHFRVGYRGFPRDLDPDPPNALVMADHLILARYLMMKICASRGTSPSWLDLSVILSVTGMQDMDRPLMALKKADHGDVSWTPCPGQGVRDIQWSPGNFQDPYNLAGRMITSIWPHTSEDMRK